MRILVTLPRDRNQLGTLTVGDFSCPCLGKADNATARRNGNPTRNPLRQFGDTPTGEYEITIGPVGWPMATYGTHPILDMEPIGGDALVAKLEGKRDGLAAHGGPLNREGRLRPTFGCIRTRNEHQKTLVDMVRAAGGKALMTVTER